MRVRVTLWAYFDGLKPAGVTIKNSRCFVLNQDKPANN